MVTAHAISRVVAGTLFTVGGICVTLASLLGTPSFWYVPCVCALIPLGFVWWFCQPSLAAALSVGPLVAAAALLRYLSGRWFAILAGCLIVAIALVLLALRDSRLRKIPLTISLVFLAAAFCTDRLLTSKVKVTTFQMSIALDGKVPWGQVGPEWDGGTPPLVLYREVNGSYCYTAFRSQELRDRLLQKHTVTVEYNVFSDFGHTRSYNVRSVDGVLLADGERVVKDAERFSGEMLMDNFSSHCWYCLIGEKPDDAQNPRSGCPMALAHVRCSPLQSDFCNLQLGLYPLTSDLTSPLPGSPACRDRRGSTARRCFRMSGGRVCFGPGRAATC